MIRVLGTHLPQVLDTLKLKTPELRLTLREVEPSEVYSQLTMQNADVSLTVLHGRLDEGLRSVELMSIPLVSAARVRVVWSSKRIVAVLPAIDSSAQRGAMLTGRDFALVFI